MKKSTVLLSFGKKNAEVPINESLFMDGEDVYTEVLIISNDVDRVFVKSTDLKPLQEIFFWLYSNEIGTLRTTIEQLQNKIECKYCEHRKRWWEFWK